MLNYPFCGIVKGGFFAVGFLRGAMIPRCNRKLKGDSFTSVDARTRTAEDATGFGGAKVFFSLARDVVSHGVTSTRELEHYLNTKVLGTVYDT